MEAEAPPPQVVLNELELTNDPRHPFLMHALEKRFSKITNGGGETFYPLRESILLGGRYWKLSRTNKITIAEFEVSLIKLELQQEEAFDKWFSPSSLAMDLFANEFKDELYKILLVKKVITSIENVAFSVPYLLHLQKYKHIYLALVRLREDDSYDAAETFEKSMITHKMLQPAGWFYFEDWTEPNVERLSPLYIHLRDQTTQFIAAQEEFFTEGVIRENQEPWDGWEPIVLAHTIRYQNKRLEMGFFIRESKKLTIVETPQGTVLPCRFLKVYIKCKENYTEIYRHIAESQKFMDIVLAAIRQIGQMYVEIESKSSYTPIGRPYAEVRPDESLSLIIAIVDIGPLRLRKSKPTLRQLQVTSPLPLSQP